MLSSFNVSESVIRSLQNVKRKTQLIWSFSSFLKKGNKILQLKENCDELSKEVIQRKAEIESIKEAVSSKEKLILMDEEEIEKLQETQTHLKVTQN